MICLSAKGTEELTQREKDKRSIAMMKSFKKIHNQLNNQTKIENSLHLKKMRMILLLMEQVV
jgi:hypothetical protein